MTKFALTYEPPVAGHKGLLSIVDDAPGAIGQQIDLDPGNIAELIKAVLFIVQFILDIIGRTSAPASPG